jgi:hypothetical protein
MKKRKKKLRIYKNGHGHLDLGLIPIDRFVRSERDDHELDHIRAVLTHHELLGVERVLHLDAESGMVVNLVNLVKYVTCGGESDAVAVNDHQRLQDLLDILHNGELVNLAVESGLTQIAVDDR